MPKTIILITIDTEFSTHKDDMGVFGEINGRSYGIAEIGRICSEYNTKATFFVDVYSSKKQYENRLRSECMHLKENGHDLQLHTHPNGEYPAKYSFGEQKEIIVKGKEIFKEWFGYYPIAHRAGDWGADYNTLDALKQNGISIDCSMFYGWPKCLLNNPGLTKNRPVEHNGILEIPATVFNCFGAGVFAPYRLLSTDGNSCSEVFYVIRKMKESGSRIITVVFHSFSFLKWNKNRTKYSPSENKIKKFESFIKAVTADSELEIKTLSELNDIYRQEPQRILGAEDRIISTGISFFAERLFDRLKQ